jgi:hypothetical protein
MSKRVTSNRNRVAWCKDDYAESEFARLRLSWNVIKIPASAIDKERSKYNRARLSSEIDDTHVDSLLRCLDSGRPMKRIVVVSLINDKYGVVSGHHRVNGFERFGLAEYEVYEVLVEDSADEEKVFTVLAVSLNAEPAWVASEEERFQQAINLEARGMDIDDAAAALQVSKEALRHRINNRRVQKLLQIAGRRVKDESSTKFSALGAIPLDSVVTAAAMLAIDAGFTMEKIGALARSLRAHKSSEQSQLAFVDRMRLEYQAKEATGEELGERLRSENPPKPNKNRTTFFHCLVDFEKLTAGVITLKSLGVTESEMEGTQARCAAVSKTFRTLSKS